MDGGGQLQAVLAYRIASWAAGENGSRTSFWLDERVLPLYIVSISVLSLAVRVIPASRLTQTFRRKSSSPSSSPRSHGNLASEATENAEVVSAAPKTLWGWTKQRVDSVGSPTIFAFKLVRLALVVALFVATILSAAKVSWTCYHIALVATLAYAVLIATANTLTSAQANSVFSLHLSITLLSVFVVYMYRDIWPLLAFTLRPLDEAEGRILWVKVALLVVAGVLVPLLEPYPYIPYNSKEPYPTPHPEQTAPLLSLFTYMFMDATVFKASRKDHLGFDDLPPPCDYDAAENLIELSYPYMDPFSGANKGNLFFALLKIFKRPLFHQSIILTLMAIFTFAGPIGTNRLLNYLEQGGGNALVKPWAWILCIAIGSYSFSLLDQFYLYLSVISFVRTEAIVTSLVFDHALRIRVKAETSRRPMAISAEQLPDDATGNDSQGLDAAEIGSGDEEDAATLHSRNTTAASTTTAEAGSAFTVVAPADPQMKAPEAAKADREVEGETVEKERKNLIGKVNNLVTSDLDNITNGRDFLFLFFSVPLNIIFGMAFLYVVLGWSAFVGLAVMLALMPVPAKVTSLMGGVQERKMKATDARVQLVTEMMNVLRMIKLFGWESQVETTIAEKREAELKIIWRRKVLELTIDIMNHTVPLIHMVVTFATFTLIQKQSLSASVVFSSMTAFNVIRSQMYRSFQLIPEMIQANVSLHRVTDFLRNTELLDEFTETPVEEVMVDSSLEHQLDVGYGRAMFSWSSDESDGTLTPSSRVFRLHIDEDVIFKRGGFNLIIGPTGSGKTSMLMALLGEMHYMPSGPRSWKNLPRGGVAYAAQESWVQSDTIKENILFGSPYDEERYKKVLYQCALTRDLSLFDAGDDTEVGEKGLTLSGGQKARVTLARAVYSRAEIVLLDDVLAALDVHTSRWIADKCFKGDLLRGRTVLLVTHNVAMAGPLADFVVSLNPDGYIVSQGSVNDAIAKDARLAEEMKHETEAIELDEIEEHTADKPIDAKAGKLIIAEEIAIGQVSRDAFKLFIANLGGKWPLLFWVQYLGTAGLKEVFDALEIWWLGWWARQYALTDPSSVSAGYYLGVYTCIVFMVVLCQSSNVLLWAYGTMRASRSIHAKLVGSLLTSTFRWLDVTPTSRVISRCTQDIQAVDGKIAQMQDFMVYLTFTLLAKLTIVVIFAPTFIIPALVTAFICGWFGKMYLKAQLSVKRELSNLKSPIIETLGSAIAGLTSIRAYNAQHAYKRKMLYRIDRYVSVARTLYSLNRWISTRIDGFSALFASSLSFFLIYGPVSYDPSIIGFILTVAVAFNEMILWWVRVYNEVEVSGNSLERILQYVNVEKEAERKEEGTPPAYWPSSGKLTVENLTARYSPDGPVVLQDVSFQIEAGERVGVVGRTGSGKSTLTLALLRCIPTEGTVVYDGIPTHTLNLDALRSNVTIIPQVPELLRGTLRHNLDMFGHVDDATLNDALRAAGLASLQRHSSSSGVLTLDTEVAAAGGNLSVGQRQIVALSRAIVRQSKLLILDEATSAIDYETDGIIQASLRTELAKDVTVLTVAHRLRTIMDSDKVMVLDAGRLVEFDTPRALLQKEDGRGVLRALVDESADREALYAMAG